MCVKWSSNVLHMHFTSRLYILLRIVPFVLRQLLPLVSVLFPILKRIRRLLPDYLETCMCYVFVSTWAAIAAKLAPLVKCAAATHSSTANGCCWRSLFFQITDASAWVLCGRRAVINHVRCAFLFYFALYMYVATKKTCAEYIWHWHISGKVDGIWVRYTPEKL